MGSWRNHVRTRLQQRDQTEKLPYIGVFTSLSQLEERFEIRKQIVDDIQSKSLEGGALEVVKNTRLLQLHLRESEHLEDKLSQTVSDLTAVLYLKEAELQYWQSRVSHYRQDALTLAKGSNTLKTTLSKFEHTIECQSKELSAMRAEQKELHEALAQTWREKEGLLQRWMEEKREEADRLNKYNDTQERWQRLAKQVKKHLHRETRKECVPIVTSSRIGETETPTSVIQKKPLVIKKQRCSHCNSHTHQFNDILAANLSSVVELQSSSTKTVWFAHPVSPENETRSREACTSSGIMQTQVQSALPQALNAERYPKWKTQQKSREYPFSDHDNKHALKDNVSVFTHGVGRRKSPDDHRQHNSHFCMCHDGDRSSPVENGGNITVHQTDFTVKQAVNIPTSNRKFPRNHKQKSAEAALAQAREPFMWFGRHGSNLSETLQVLAATNCSAPSKP